MLIPKNRHEYYLAVISGNDYPTFPSKTREELYLAKLAGREVDVPIPKTPKERAYYNIINDIKFEPENRWQTFVAAANDDSITAPIPRTREEIWWTNISLSHEVIVEYVGTLPTTLQTVEGYLESYKIYGNTVQDGTPTPENPIVPSGCGVRTANLWNEVFPAPSENINQYIPIYVGDGDFTFSTNGGLYNSRYAMYMFMAGRVTSGGSTANNGVSAGHPRTVTAINGYVTIVYHGYSDEYSPENFWSMLNTGSSPLPYEPYGYKLPILSNSTATDIYLGEVETTRRIKKLVFDGTESWTAYKSRASTFFYTSVASSRLTDLRYTISSHFVGATISTNNTNVGVQILQTQLRIRPESVASTTTSDFKSYLAAQYAAGTPVTVWYVLKEPETAVVNEPLMKIGDYADTIDSTQTSVQIPTAAGTTVIDYNGEPKPDKVELTYKTIKKSYISADDKVYQDPNGQLLGG